MSWIVTLSQALNQGVLPADYYALPEQTIAGPIPDVLTLRLPPVEVATSGGPTAFSVAEAPPRTRLTRRAEQEVYAKKADLLAIHHRHGQVVAVIEIVSPGNKAGSYALRTFVEKAAKLIAAGVHLLIIDLFPPSRRDPQGIHKTIWDQFEEEEFAMPADKPLTLVSYEAAAEPAAYIEPVAVGDALADMPIFLRPGYYVPTPLEPSYRRTWDEFFPARLKRLLEGPKSVDDGRDRP